jgi:transposase
MDHCTCGPGALRCARADELFGVPGMHVIDVERVEASPGRRRPALVRVSVETDEREAFCPSCGAQAVGHGRRLHRAHDAPCFGAVTVVVWRKRIWRCPHRSCPQVSWSETHDQIGVRAKLTTRGIEWAVAALAWDDTSVSAVARRLGVDWHTVWDAVRPVMKRRVENPSRLSGVTSLGVDEHIWRPGRHRSDRAVTGMVDLTRDQHGRVRARLLDVVLGRSGTAYADWLKQTPPGFVEGIRHAALDPFRGYANAIRDELHDTVAVLDAFHVVQLGTKVVDEVRRRVQQDTLGHRGHKHDPLYAIRGLLRHGIENLTTRQLERLDAGLAAGDPSGEVALAWQCYQKLRSIYHARTPGQGRRTAEDVIATFASCPVPEVARLARTLKAWRTQILAYFTTDGVSNGGTEAINGLIEKTRRIAHGFRSFDNYRLRILLVTDGTRPWRRP